MPQSAKEFEIDGNKLIKYNGSDSVVYIPNSVVHILPDAFNGCENLVRVETPVNLSTIGNGAFLNCPKLKEVIMPGFLFNRINCSDIFDDVKKIYFRFYASADGDAVYDKQQVEELPVITTIISDDGDEKATISDDEIPTTSQVVEQRVVEQKVVEEKVVRTDIQPVEVINNVAVVVSEEAAGQPIDESDVTYANDVTIVENLDDFETQTLQQKIENIVPVEVVKDIQPEVKKHEYKEFKDFIIEDSTVVKYTGNGGVVEVPDFITVIGEKAFSNSAVTQVILPEGLLNISDGAFNWCDNLRTINFPATLKIIGEEAFANCSSLEEALITESVKFIGPEAFHACSGMKRVSIPQDATIGRRTFDFCIALETVLVPDGYTSLPDGAFSHCEGLKRVHLPDTLTSLGNWAFAECYSLEEINYPKSLNSIGDVAFMNCRSLKELTLPHSVTHLGRQCYVGCEGLSAVFLPAHLLGQVKPMKVFNRLKHLHMHFIDLA